ncbi:hypothetical protein OROMI_017726 [Orobanche minor]
MAPFLCRTIPYKYNEEKGTYKVLVISAQKKSKGYLFPKGGWEVDEDISKAAARETKEEAGVRGVLQGRITNLSIAGVEEKLGEYPHGNKAVVHMFPLQVDEQMCCWSEIFIRKRKWVSVEEAARLLHHDYMRTALEELAGRWNQDATPGAYTEPYSPEGAGDQEIY